jgi:type IV pilus assembly protein PilE
MSREAFVRSGLLHRCRHDAGFTLIELMIVVAIIGIIAAIAYPSYLDNVRDTRRAATQADLMELAQWMERQYSANFSYLDGSGNAPTLPFTQSPRNGTAFYVISFDGSVAANTYTLQAVPSGDQSNDECGTLRVINTGAKSAVNGGSVVAGCW